MPRDVSATLSVESGDILRLIQAHLTESGLHESCRMLREESGVSAAGVCHSNFKTWAMKGEWGLILQSLATLDKQRCRVRKELLADVHEMSILELAEIGDLELAYTALRLTADDVDEACENDQAQIPRSRILDQKLAALASFRASNDEARRKLLVPDDYFGAMSKRLRREDIGKRLTEAVPLVPPSRLVTLLQQAVKWQSHTGELPIVKRHWDADESAETMHAPGENVKRKRRRKEFDLVLGEVDVPDMDVGDAIVPDEVNAEAIPSSPYSSIKFGKQTTAECAVYLPDASGLVTASSDGLVEIYGAPRFSSLRMDLPYQEKEDLLWYSSAIMSLAVSNDGAMIAGGAADGTILVWKVDNGKRLRQFSAHNAQVVSCLAFSHDGSHVLSGSHDSTCREFGLRTSRMLKEFRGHTSYVNVCQYVLADGASHLRVLSGSADGTVRVWDGKSSEIMYVLRPSSIGSKLSTVGSSILMETKVEAATDDGTSPNVHSVIPMHSPQQSMVIVPRGSRAFLVSLNGQVIRTFDGDGGMFVAATVSPSNHWLYAVTEGGVCCVFDVTTGTIEKKIRDFALESGREKDATEITGLVHHPQEGLLGAFSNNKSQKRGMLTLWK